MDTTTTFQGGMGGDDPMPTAPNPVSPSRTDLDPAGQPGVDELPNDEGAIPLDTDDEPPAQGQ